MFTSPGVGLYSRKSENGLREWGKDKLRVHSGFLTLFHSSIELMDEREKLHNLLKECKGKIYITGHSLGGALATLCAYHFSDGYFQRAEDNEKVGKRIKLSRAEARMYRVTHGGLKKTTHTVI